MIRDFNVEWLEKRVYLPAEAFQSYITGAGTNPIVVFQDVNTSGIKGIKIHQASDGISTLWDPWEVDINHVIRFRVWSSSTGTASGDTWTITYTALTDGAQNTGVTIVAPATALDTVVVANATAYVANQPQASAFGVIARKKLADTTELLAIRVLSDMAQSAADNVSLLGLEIRYTPRRTAGPRRNILGGRRLNLARPLGVVLATAQEGL